MSNACAHKEQDNVSSSMTGQTHCTLFSFPRFNTWFIMLLLTKVH